MGSLLLEIGTEEIPAGYIEPALKALSSIISKKLDQSRLSFEDVKTYGTPCRLAVIITNIADMQKTICTVVKGPPENIGFDKDKNPTIAAKKFAEKSGVSLSDLFVKKTKKGSYLCAEKTEKGLETKIILKDILPNAILSIPFPKTMRWADLDIFFARPIRTVLALFDSELISFSLGNIQSSLYTFGHKFMHPEKITIKTTEDYIAKLSAANVVVDINKRKTLIKNKISNTATSLGGDILPDNELIDIVSNLVEYPFIVSGKFDIKFLDLPDQVLINAMREHQKYFTVIDKNSNVMPFFVAVNNTCANDMGLVAKGHERVLRARLEDAQFFFNCDINESFDTWVEKLKGVLFQAKLGSMYEKAMRIKKLADFITKTAITVSNTKDSHKNVISEDYKEQIVQAAVLCKADLVSHMVGEFPKLQGVMGSIYALNSKKSDVIAMAIKEHYLPAYSGDQLPESIAGAILSIADKIDTICGCFNAGLLPTGTYDPYALRRQGIGIICIMREKNFSFSLKSIIQTSINLYDMKKDNTNEITNHIFDFLTDRMSNLIIEEGFSKDVTKAVLSSSADNIPDAWKKVQALEKLKSEPYYVPLTVTFKRVVNIIKKSAPIKTGTDFINVDTNLFQDECESTLFSAYNLAQTKVDDNLYHGLYSEALHEIASLRDSVDNFFDTVLVMSDDKNIRNNRLSMLCNIANLFGSFADFSKISS